MNNKPPTVFVIFGSTGNLVQKKLIPSLYHLFNDGILTGEFTIYFVARDQNATIDSIIEKAEISLLRQSGNVSDAVIAKLKTHIRLIYMDSTDPQDYKRLRDELDALDGEKATKHNRLYYLAIPPSIFANVIDCLAATGLNDESQGVARRILVEKPFGTNLSSARQLVEHVGQYFQESQVYRIDHYLAKETAQNILAFRFNNPIIEDLWGSKYIDHIQITAAETIDIEGRANFYDNMGAMRDLVQSHLLQLLALTMMDVPYPLDSENIHAEKLALLDAIKPINPSDVDQIAVRGQYDGYRQDAKNNNTITETFAALYLQVNNPRWANVPVLLRTGKALVDKKTEISVVFKDRTHRGIPPNILTIRIQPNEGINVGLKAKKPGFDDEYQDVHMDFCYETSFDGYRPDAYERVLVDAMLGDQTLFATSDEVLRCWEIIEPVVEAWRQNGDNLFTYSRGSWGPEASMALAERFGCHWLSDTSHVCAVHSKP